MTPLRTTLVGLGATATLMGGIDASVMNETPLERVEIIAEERVEAKQIENVVETTLPWKDQPGIKVKYDLGEPTLGERLADKRKQEVVTEVVPFADSQGFKVDILLNERPATNCFTYQLEGWEQYDFFHQPALTDEEIAEGASRPEEIVGSYAVYHKTLRDHQIGQENYATGKFAHIPYPYVWEVENATNTKHRADSFDITDGLMTVCVNGEWLDKATYPVRVDPTFGYTSQGASGFGSGVSVYKGVAGTVDFTGRLQSVSVFGRGSSATANLKGAVYTSSDSLVEGNETITVMPDSSTFSLYSFPLSASVDVGTTYVAMSMMGGAGIIAVDTGGSSGYRATTTFGTWANPVTWSATSTNNLFSVYATYELLPAIIINNARIHINNAKVRVE